MALLELNNHTSTGKITFVVEQIAVVTQHHKGSSKCNIFIAGVSTEFTVSESYEYVTEVLNSFHK